MKFSSLLTLATTLFATSALAQGQNADINLSNPAEHADGEFLDTDQLSNQLKYLIDYKILEHDTEGGVPLQLFNGDEITVDYTFANHEDHEISVVGVGGQFLSPLTGANVANITDARLGPLDIAPGEVANFEQRIRINLDADNYVMVPGLYILRDSSLALIGTKTTLTIINDRPVSILNPQFLVLELLFVGALGAAGFFGYSHFNREKDIKILKKNLKAQAAKASGVSDEWLPAHLKKTSQRKAK